MLKKKKLVRLVAMIMTMAMLLSTGIAQVFAEDTTETQVRNSQIVSALRRAENYKDELGLENVNFSAIAVANPIKTYTVISSGLQEGLELYPLKVGNELVAFAIEVVSGKFVIGTALVDEINEVVAENSAFAILYDKDSCLLYDGAGLYCLVTNEEVSAERGDLQSVADVAVYANDIDRNSLSSAVSVGYTPRMARSSTYYGCSISYVPQEDYGICWAACIAAITNYKIGTSWTAISLAMHYYGSDFDKPLDFPYIDEALTDYTLCNYVYSVYSIPSSATILNKIGNGHPLVGAIYHWDQGISSLGDYIENEDRPHVVVICGIETLDNSLRIMDPDNGFRTAVPDSMTGGYVYYYEEDGYFRRIRGSYYVQS